MGGQAPLSPEHLCPFLSPTGPGCSTQPPASIGHCLVPPWASCPPGQHPTTHRSPTSSKEALVRYCPKGSCLLAWLLSPFSRLPRPLLFSKQGQKTPGTGFRKNDASAASLLVKNSCHFLQRGRGLERKGWSCHNTESRGSSLHLVDEKSPSVTSADCQAQELFIGSLLPPQTAGRRSRRKDQTRTGLISALRTPQGASLVTRG